MNLLEGNMVYSNLPHLTICILHTTASCSFQEIMHFEFEDLIATYSHIRFISLLQSGLLQHSDYCNIFSPKYFLPRFFNINLTYLLCSYFWKESHILVFKVRPSEACLVWIMADNVDSVPLNVVKMRTGHKNTRNL